jgi:general secretion pathway protein C
MKSRPPSERLIRNVSIAALLALIGFIIADLSILSQREKWFPSQPPPPKLAAPRPMAFNDRSAYNIITTQNIFHADQTDPDPFGVKGGAGQKAPDAEPVPSNLPIQLVGTIVHVNPARSVATLQLKSKNDEIAVKVDGEIPDGLAVVTKIKRNRLEFRNNASGQLEYVEIKDDGKLQFNAGAKGTGAKQVGEVLQKSETEFELKQADITRLTGNLPELLQQARAVPVMGAGGQVEGFNLVDIQPGSIYEKLGLKKGDIIRSVNGEKIDSPGKAMDMYNALRSGASSIQIGIGRSGADQNLNFSITQ